MTRKVRASDLLRDELVRSKLADLDVAVAELVAASVDRSEAGRRTLDLERENEKWQRVMEKLDHRQGLRNQSIPGEDTYRRSVRHKASELAAARVAENEAVARADQALRTYRTLLGEAASVVGRQLAEMEA